MKIEIFKTNVQDENAAHLLVLHLQKIISDCLINFDLEDKDNLLKVSGNRNITSLVVNALTDQGIDCEHLTEP